MSHLLLPLTTRRKILKAGLGAVVFSQMASRHTASAATAFGQLKPLVVCDLQNDASIRFGRQARQLGAPVRAIRSDCTRLWREDLIPLWRTDSTIQLGMTGFDSLFCLSMMAHDYGRRVVYRIHHRPRPDGTITHEAIGFDVPNSLQYQKSIDWAERTAELLLLRTKAPFQASDAAASHQAAAKGAALDRHSLVSWIMAPTAIPMLMASQIVTP